MIQFDEIGIQFQFQLQNSSICQALLIIKMASIETEKMEFITMTMILDLADLLLQL